jgi:DNA-directed RNA polymerase
MRVTGHLQREAGVTHVIAREIEDISPLLDHLLTQDKAQGETHSA